ncbi:MAG TPA: hypothetical protein VLM11_08505 [Streptosporangiaceae bacterium]|nr:hypothetical protein [Streptosporangiaceae bacterium]
MSAASVRGRRARPGDRTGLTRDANRAVQLLEKFVLAPLAPFIKYWSTPKHAARVTTKVLTSEPGQTGVYYDENAKPMAASAQVGDPAFACRVVTEIRAPLATVPMNTAPTESQARRER